ncbi:MAG TPA: 5-oxoprolinase subunit PxpA [Opitutaceae bacterium]
MARVDLNCDLGEGAGHDAALMPWVTSANIACGAHAGDEATMQATVELARRHGVAIGAHPGYADRANFGRVEQALPADAVYQLVLNQTQALQRIATAAGTRVRHVKPHGALYNQAARDAVLASAVARAVRAADATLMLFGPAGSELVRAGTAAGLAVACEVFADRTYEPDGSLTPRTRAGSVITDEAVAVAQVLRMVTAGRVRATDGADIVVQADTVCLHGDGVHAVAFARKINEALAVAGVDRRSFRA